MGIRPRPCTSVLKFSSGLGNRHFPKPGLEALEDRTLLTAGDLDPTFGMGGKALAQFVGPVGAQASRVAIQADGKIVEIGQLYDAEGNSAITRLNSDGTRDTMFGSGGYVFTDIRSYPILAIQADAKILIAGAFETAPGTSEFVVERFQPDGTSVASEYPLRPILCSILTAVEHIVPMWLPRMGEQRGVPDRFTLAIQRSGELLSRYRCPSSEAALSGLLAQHDSSPTGGAHAGSTAGAAHIA